MSHKKLKVLFLGPRPKELGVLRTKEEVRGILYRVAKGGDQIDLIEGWDVQFTDLPGLLVQHRPDIVHLTMHGSEKGLLAFEDELGRTDAVPVAAVTQLFRANAALNSVRCVVLNACYMAGLAETMAETIDYVIGSPDSLLNSAAIAFSEIFYQMLSGGQSIQVSFGMARAASMAKGGAPVLHVRPGADARDSLVAVTAPTPARPLMLIVVVDADKSYANELKKRLKPHQDRGTLEFWDPSMIRPGEHRWQALNEKVHRAHLVLLLLSADALADTEWNKIAELAMGRHAQRQSTVIPILVRPVSIAGTSFEELERLPGSGRALSVASDRDEAWVSIVERLLMWLK